MIVGYCSPAAESVKAMLDYCSSPFRITAIPIPIPDYSYSPDTQKGVFWIVCIYLGMGQGRQLQGGTGLKAEKRGGDGEAG